MIFILVTPIDLLVFKLKSLPLDTSRTPKSEQGFQFANDFLKLFTGIQRLLQLFKYRNPYFDLVHQNF